MRRIPALPALALAALLLPWPASAQNREHVQMMGDIRMLQEQANQLQLILTQLADAVQMIVGRLEAQENATRKGFADQGLAVSTLSSEIRIVREKVDDTNLRMGTLTQEIEALRRVIPRMTMGAPADGEPGLPGAGVPAPGDPMDDGPLGPPPAVAAGSPQRLFEQAYADFASGQWTLAVSGFEHYINTFPRSGQAPEAQFYIGESYYLDGRYDEAIEAFTQVINVYPGAKVVPGAYYKRGLAYDRLGQTDRARESFEYVVSNHPDTEAATLARQALDRLSRRTG